MSSRAPVSRLRASAAACVTPFALRGGQACDMRTGAAWAALAALLSSLALASAQVPPYLNTVSLGTQKHVRAHAHASQAALWLCGTGD